MPMRGHSAKIEPAIIPGAEGVHRPMDQHRRFPSAVRGENTIHIGGIADAWKTIVVYDDIVPVSPVCRLKERNLDVTFLPGLMPNDPLNRTFDPLSNSMNENFLSGIVIMGTPARDQQRFDRRRDHRFHRFILLRCAADTNTRKDRATKKNSGSATVTIHQGRGTQSTG